jgi:hypothetical protein
MFDAFGVGFGGAVVHADREEEVAEDAVAFLHATGGGASGGGQTIPP